MSKRHKKHEEHENHERWLVSYADFITLLFAFFVVMYAVSEVDAKKAKKLERSVQFAFHYAGTGGNDRLPIFDSPTTALDIGQRPTVVPPIVPLTAAEIDAVERDALEDIGGEVNESLGTLAPILDVAEVVEVAIEERGVVIRLSLDHLFDPGGDVLVPAAVPVIDQIAAVLALQDREIRVEGHTDTTPMRSERFPTNWELSTARATNMVRYLVTAHGIAPARLAASGYGEFRPIDDNDTAAGRARNRRVDVVVLSRRAETAEPHAARKQPVGADPVPQAAEAVTGPPAPAESAPAE